MHQGDGLASPSPDDRGGLHRACGMFGFTTPQGRRVEMPAAFARQAGLPQRLRHFVDACRREAPMPAHLLGGLDTAQRQTLRDAHAKLTEVIAAEGDGVWSWFMRNHMATATLAESKVDRIVANPPWVRMSEIQVADRRETLDEMIREAGLYASGVSIRIYDLLDYDTGRPLRVRRVEIGHRHDRQLRYRSSVHRQMRAALPDAGGTGGAPAWKGCGMDREQGIADSRQLVAVP